MNKKTSTFLMMVIALSLTLLGCEQGPPPCTTLPAPSQAEITAAAAGSEIEREVGYTECVVVGDRWVEDSSD